MQTLENNASYAPESKPSEEQALLDRPTSAPTPLEKEKASLKPPEGDKIHLGDGELLR